MHVANPGESASTMWYWYYLMGVISEHGITHDPHHVLFLDVTPMCHYARDFCGTSLHELVHCINT